MESNGCQESDMKNIDAREESTKVDSANGKAKGDLCNTRVQRCHQIVKMPPNTWGSFILSTIMYKHWLSGDCFEGEFFIVGGIQIAGLVCSIVTQWVLIDFLGQLAAARHDPDLEHYQTFESECNPRYGDATFTCTLLLLGQVTSNEVRETVSMWKFINQIPSLYQSRPEEHDNIVDQTSLVTVVWEDSDNNIGKPTTGIGYLHSLLLYTVLVWKAAFAFWLGVNSFDFVMHTQEDHEILLNCTATLFICEIDDIVFKVVNPTSLQRMFEAYPAFYDPSLKEKVSSCKDFLSWIFRCCPSEPDKKDKGLSDQKPPWIQIALYGSLPPAMTLITNYLLYDFYCRDFVHENIDPAVFDQQRWYYISMFLLFFGLGLSIGVDIWMVANGCEWCREWVQRFFKSPTPPTLKDTE